MIPNLNQIDFLSVYEFSKSLRAFRLENTLSAFWMMSSKLIAPAKTALLEARLIKYTLDVFEDDLSILAALYLYCSLAETGKFPEWVSNLLKQSSQIVAFFEASHLRAEILERDKLVSSLREE